MVSEVFVSTDPGAEVIPEPIGPLGTLEIPVPIGLLPRLEEIGYGADSVFEGTGAGSEPEIPVLKGTVGTFSVLE